MSRLEYTTALLKAQQQVVAAQADKTVSYLRLGSYVQTVIDIKALLQYIR